MIEIEMSLFGAFRKFWKEQSPLLLRVNAPASVDQIKLALSNKLAELSNEFGKNSEQLIKDSAIASDTEVLLSTAVLNESCRLSILPPVCGG